MKVYIAADHAGVGLKAALQKSFPQVSWEDLGPSNGDRVDYPDFAKLLCEKLKTDHSARGILICGSGIGMSITANRFSWIRAALVENPVGARLSREHNNSNVLCLGARFLAAEYAADITRAWLDTSFSEDARHIQRIQKMN